MLKLTVFDEYRRDSVSKFRPKFHSTNNKNRIIFVFKSIGLNHHLV